MPLPIFSQNNAAFWLGKRPSAAPANLLLDDYPGAAAAYSLRKLSSTYTGNAFIVTKANGTSQVIGFSGNDFDETTLLSFCGSDDCYLTSWYDQSGNNKTLITTNYTTAPLICSGGAIIVDNSGNNAIKFDGVNDFLFTSLFIVQPFTSFITTSIFSKASSNTFFDATGIRSLFFWSSSLNAVLLNNGSSITNGDLNLNDVYLLSSLSNSSSSYIRINGTTTVSGNSGTSGIGNLYLGNNAGGSGTVYSSIFLNEFIIYNSNQSSNTNGIESNINSSYQIP